MEDEGDRCGPQQRNGDAPAHEFAAEGPKLSDAFETGGRRDAGRAGDLRARLCQVRCDAGVAGRAGLCGAEVGDRRAEVAGTKQRVGAIEEQGSGRGDIDGLLELASALDKTRARGIVVLARQLDALGVCGFGLRNNH